MVVHREEEAKEKLERKQEITTTTPPHRKEPLRRHPGEYILATSRPNMKNMSKYSYMKKCERRVTL